MKLRRASLIALVALLGASLSAASRIANLGRGGGEKEASDSKGSSSPPNEFDEEIQNRVVSAFHFLQNLGRAAMSFTDGLHRGSPESELPSIEHEDKGSGESMDGDESSSSSEEAGGSRRDGTENSDEGSNGNDAEGSGEGDEGSDEGDGGSSRDDSEGSNSGRDDESTSEGDGGSSTSRDDESTSEGGEGSGRDDSEGSGTGRDDKGSSEDDSAIVELGKRDISSSLSSHPKFQALHGLNHPEKEDSGEGVDGAKSPNDSEVESSDDSEEVESSDDSEVESLCRRFTRAFGEFSDYMIENRCFY